MTRGRLLNAIAVGLLLAGLLLIVTGHAHDGGNVLFCVGCGLYFVLVMAQAVGPRDRR